MMEGNRSRANAPLLMRILLSSQLSSPNAIRTVSVRFLPLSWTVSPLPFIQVFMKQRRTAGRTETSRVSPWSHWTGRKRCCHRSRHRPPPACLVHSSFSGWLSPSRLLYKDTQKKDERRKKDEKAPHFSVIIIGRRKNVEKIYSRLFQGSQLLFRESLFSLFSESSPSTEVTSG